MTQISTGLCFTALVASGLLQSEPKTSIDFPVPKGWKQERLPLPAPFAPDMKLKGLEDLRFAPGMFQPESDSFFSYVFVFQVQQQPKVTQQVLERELLAYYRGLAVAVLKSRNQKVDTDRFAVKLDAAKPKETKPVHGHQPQSYSGTIKWVEPFATRKQQTLRLDIQTWTCGESKSAFVCVCASPKELSAPIWKQMLKLRASIHCHHQDEKPDPNSGTR